MVALLTSGVRSMSIPRIRADFNGLFGEILCLSHHDELRDDAGVAVALGSRVIAWDEDVDELGERDDLIASGTVEPAPEWLHPHGSRWVLRIDAKRVRHESDLASEDAGS